MAMVAVVYWLPTGELMAQADWLGPKVGGHWRCFCSHRVKRMNSCSALCMTAPQIYVVQVYFINIGILHSIYPVLS